MVDRFSEEHIQVTVAHGLNIEVQKALEGIANAALASSASSDNYMERTATIIEALHDSQSHAARDVLLKQLADNVDEIRSRIAREVGNADFAGQNSLDLSAARHANPIAGGESNAKGSSSST